MATVDLQNTSPLATEGTLPVELESSGLAVATTSLPAGLTGVAYSAQLGASGGSLPYTWQVTTGALPAGLTLTTGTGSTSRGGLFGVTPFVTGESPTTTTNGFAALTGRTCTARKIYFKDSEYPTTASPAIQSCLTLGLTAYLCYRPAYALLSYGERTQLQASLQAFRDMGLKVKAVLRQEIEDQALTPAQYKTMLTFYEPAVHAVSGVTLVHDSAGYHPELQASFFPGSLGIVDEYGIDYYGSAYNATVPKRIDAFAALVAATGKPLSILEMGNSSNPPPSPGPPDSVVTAYLQYVTRIVAAQPVGACIWYEGDGPNHITSASDFRIPLLQALCDTITTTTGGGTSGAITGTPSAAGTSSFTVTVTDHAAATASAALSITITSAGALTITTTSLPAATVGVAYSQALAQTGGTPPYTWQVTTGSLPAGLSLDPAAGVISGTPAADAATSGFTITLTDASFLTTTQVLFITVVAGTPPPNPGGSPGLGWPQLVVEAGFSAAMPQVPPGTFILDDPVYGQLSEGNMLADATTWTDLAGYFRNGSIARPSTRVQGPLNTYQGGTFTGVFDNTAGNLDPDNTSGPYYGSLRPMVPVQVRAIYGSVSYPLWSGFASSWAGADLSYDMGYDEVTVTADDGFKILAGITIPPVPPDGLAGDGEPTGARITRILNVSGWYTDHRRIDPGDSVVQGTLFGDTALNLLQLTADTEAGALYIDGAGNVVFRHRQAPLEDARSTTVQAVFGDLPGTVHGSFTELACVPHRRADDDTQLANLVEATSLGGTEQDAQNLVSQRKYLFPRSYTRSDLILEDDLTTRAWAQWVLAISAAGDDHFDSVTLDPLADPAGLFPQILSREIGDRIQVWRRPQNSAQVITQDCFIRGIQHDIDAVNGTWATTWTLQSAARYTGFLILGDAVKGQLDSGNMLAY